MKSDRVHLPKAEPRCDPSMHCVMASRCARIMASIPAFAEMRDYSTEAGGGTALCPGYMDLTAAKAMMERKNGQRP